MSDYTLTTEEVRVNYAILFGPERMQRRLESFDRWLASHDAEVRADEREKAAKRVEALRGIETDDEYCCSMIGLRKSDAVAAARGDGAE